MAQQRVRTTESNVEEKDLETQLPVSDEQLKAILGEDDFNDLMQVRTRRATRAMATKIKETADAMVNNEAGKYYSEYQRLDKELNDLYEKAQGEAKAIIEAEAKPEVKPAD